MQPKTVLDATWAKATAGQEARHHCCVGGQERRCSKQWRRRDSDSGQNTRAGHLREDQTWSERHGSEEQMPATCFAAPPILFAEPVLLDAGAGRASALRSTSARPVRAQRPSNASSTPEYAGFGAYCASNNSGRSPLSQVCASVNPQNVIASQRTSIMHTCTTSRYVLR